MLVFQLNNNLNRNSNNDNNSHDSSRNKCHIVFFIVATYIFRTSICMYRIGVAFHHTAISTLVVTPPKIHKASNPTSPVSLVGRSNSASRARGRVSAGGGSAAPHEVDETLGPPSNCFQSLSFSWRDFPRLFFSRENGDLHCFSLLLLSLFGRRSILCFFSASIARGSSVRSAWIEMHG